MNYYIRKIGKNILGIVSTVVAITENEKIIVK